MAGTTEVKTNKAPSQLDGGPIENMLQELYTRLRRLAGGSLATYIPELATAQAEWFGLSVATLDGHVYGVGDCELPFTIQSVSKPFVYALALADRGVALDSPSSTSELCAMPGTALLSSSAHSERTSWRPEQVSHLKSSRHTAPPDKLP